MPQPDLGHDVLVNHTDIRIGTLTPFGKGASYIREILPHGFESFQLFAWQYLPTDLDFDRAAGEIAEAIAGRAVVSSIGMFGNPITDERTRADFLRAIELAPKFGCNMVTGFTGADSSMSVPKNMPRFKEVWTPIVKRAEDLGVRIAFEHCDMGGDWNRPAWNFAHASTAWDLIFDLFPGDTIGLEWEPCHHMGSFVDPLPQLRKLVKTGKLYHVHGKDATVAHDIVRDYGIRSGKTWIWHRTPGFGDTNWTDVITILRQAKWRGTIDIEGWHDPVYKDELEMTGQVHGLNYLKACRGGAFVKNPS
jgi:sugar phosphate isomerase/epimerase